MIQFYEGGQKKEQYHYRNGMSQGIAKAWYWSGQKKNEFNYKDGKFHGLITRWDKEGNITSQIRYENHKQVEKPKVAQPRQKQLPPEPQSALQGKWKLVAMEAAGNQGPPEVIAVMKYEFKGEKLRICLGKQKRPKEFLANEEAGFGQVLISLEHDQGEQKKKGEVF